MKAMYKYELAEAAGVSRRTFQRWLQRHEKELIPLGYENNAKILNPAIIKYLCDTFVIEV